MGIFMATQKKTASQSKSTKSTNTKKNTPKPHKPTQSKAKITQPVTPELEVPNVPVSEPNNPDLPPYSDAELLIKTSEAYQLYWRWSHFELKITEPNAFEPIDPPKIILPELIDGSSEVEFVYPIYDFGNVLSTSKGEEIHNTGMSMCKLHFTIEKMIYLLIEKLKSGGIDESVAVHIEFDGHELAQRKAFESVINLAYNVVVTNFDPGAWGDKYLAIVKRLGEKGYGYPLKSPRVEVYHRSYSASTAAKKSV
jgi:hypothetical protein